MIRSNNAVMRVSDSERDATIRVLHDGHADGRIGPATFEERVELALTAKSAAELRDLTVDVKRVSRVRTWFADVLSRPESIPTGPDGPSLWLRGVGHRPFVVGRGEHADLVVADETVSRVHVHIVRRSDAFVLTDLDSTNGTWIDGRRVVQVEVAPGDVVRLGRMPLRLL